MKVRERHYTGPKIREKAIQITEADDGKVSIGSDQEGGKVAVQLQDDGTATLVEVLADGSTGESISGVEVLPTEPAEDEDASKRRR